MTDKRYTVAEAAERLGVNRVTLYRWIDRGWVKDFARDYKGDLVITDQDLDRIRAWKDGLKRAGRGKDGKS